MGLPVPKPKPTVLLTRPLAQSKQFAQDLRADGFSGEIVISPLLTIKPVEFAVDTSAMAGAIFTSRNAIDFAPEAKRPAWCVGEKTAEKARDHGWHAISADGDVETLRDEMIKAQPAGKWVHFRGAHSRGNLADKLNEAGINTEEKVVYDQIANPLSEDAKNLLSGEMPVIVPLFSPRSARLFADAAPFKAPIWVVAMSDAVARNVKKIKTEHLIVSPKATAKAMLSAVLTRNGAR